MATSSELKTPFHKVQCQMSHKASKTLKSLQPDRLDKILKDVSAQTSYSFLRESEEKISAQAIHSFLKESEEKINVSEYNLPRREEMAEIKLFDGVKETLNKATSYVFSKASDDPDNPQLDRLEKISKAVIECGVSLMLITAGHLFEKSTITYFIPSLITNTVRWIIAIAVLVLALDIIRRGILVAKPELYASFCNKISESVRGLLSKPDQQPDEDLKK